MDVFRPIPIDVIQINEKSIVDLFIKQEDRLMPFLAKDGIFTRNHLDELNHYGVCKIFIRGRESDAFEKYVSAYTDKILTDPAVPSKVKAATFYVSSVHALKNAFEDPNPNRLRRYSTP